MAAAAGVATVSSATLANATTATATATATAIVLPRLAVVGPDGWPLLPHCAAGTAGKLAEGFESARVRRPQESNGLDREARILERTKSEDTQKARQSNSKKSQGGFEKKKRQTRDRGRHAKPSSQAANQAKKKVDTTPWCSRVVPYRSTDQAQ